ncbi:MAG: imidazole glycerol phosphate synthase cyclase subunit [Desulfarculus sp.]|nr:imidazole glycerol phosphate synthase cyclase subunit [Desulfarculus sp.]
MSVRIIPRLDIKGPNLVKGVHLEGLRVLGKPERFARHYYEQGADELFYMDAVASLYGRNSLLDIIERTAREIFIPLTVGGGLRTSEDINQVLRAGADKAALNTAAIARPELISEAARRFGSSTIVVSIEAMKKPDGSYEAFTDFGRQSTGMDAIVWAKRAEELGAGELLVISIDREGTGEGYDLELTRRISRAVSIPVIALGGAGNVDHVLQVIEEGAADAVSLASVLHYNFIKCAECLEDDYSAEGNLTFLRREGKGFGKIADATLPELKRHLLAHGVDCRWEGGWAA